MNIIEFIKNTVQRTLSKYDERFSTVAESGSYDDLTNKPTIPAAYDDTAIQAAVAAKQDKITGGTSAQVLMKNSATEGDFNWQTLVGSGWGVAGFGTGSVTFTDSTNATTSVDVSSYGFANASDYEVLVEGASGHPYVFSVISKTENAFVVRGAYSTKVNVSSGFKYTIIAKGYGTANAGNVPLGGTTGQALVKESDADGDLGWANFPEAYDDTALAARVTAVEDGKASLQIAAIPGGGGGEEINAAVSQGENSVSVNYYKDSELPNTLNLNVDSDQFSIPTTAYADEKAAEAQFNSQQFTILRLTQKQDTLVSGTSIKTINGESILGSGDVSVSQMPSYIVDKPEGNNAQVGNVVQVGTLQDVGGSEVGIFEFFYRTSALPNNTTKEYTLLPLLQDYDIVDFLDGTGVTSNGIFIGNGRTDGTNYVVIQQFSKNRKGVILRTYQDYSAQTALLKIKFLGTKTSTI